MQEFIKYFENRPIHFGVLVLGICACTFFISSCTQKVAEFDYQYRIERLNFIQKSDELFWNRKQEEK